MIASPEDSRGSALLSRGRATPDVSIVVPCYNDRAFLSRAVESARRQRSVTKEVIVVDDGSTAPETAEAIGRLPDDVRVVRQDNRGVAAARNRGFEAANGRYILPLDSDDWIDPDYAGKALALAAGREDAFVYSWVTICGEYEAVLRKHWNPLEQFMVNGIAYCLLIPKALWRRVGGYDEAMRLGCEDWEFNIRLTLAGAEGLCLPEPVFHYRVAASGMARSVARPNYGAIWRAMQKKHAAIYTLSNFAARLRAGTREKRRYPAWALLGLWGAHRLMPDALFMALFRFLVLVRDRMRGARTLPARR